MSWMTTKWAGCQHNDLVLFRSLFGQLWLSDQIDYFNWLSRRVQNPPCSLHTCSPYKSMLYCWPVKLPYCKWKSARYLTCRGSCEDIDCTQNDVIDMCESVKTFGLFQVNKTITLFLWCVKHNMPHTICPSKFYHKQIKHTSWYHFCRIKNSWVGIMFVFICNRLNSIWICNVKQVFRWWRSRWRHWALREGFEVSKHS